MADHLHAFVDAKCLRLVIMKEATSTALRHLDNIKYSRLPLSVLCSHKLSDKQLYEIPRLR